MSFFQRIPISGEVVPRTSENKIGTAIIILFLLPFCAVGVFTGYLAIEALLEADWERGGFMLIFALLFGGVGFGLLTMVLLGSGASKRQDERRRSYASQPWMWRDDWASGRIRSSARTAIAFFWFFAVAWNLVCIPLVYFLPGEILEKENYAALLGFLFPIVGIGLLTHAIRLTLARGKFGESILLMRSVPGVIGGEVAGSVLLGRRLEGTEPVSARLTSVRRTRTGSGKNRETREEILWQDERYVPQREPSPEGSGEAIPIRFQVPYECRPTDETETDNTIIWRLEVSSSEPGIDYSATFEVPVFTTAQSSPALNEQKVAQLALGVAGAPERPTNLEIRPAATGGTEYVLVPRASVGSSIGLVVFTLVWTGVVALLVISGAPLFFPLVFGAFDLLLIGIIIAMHFLVVIVVVEPDAITVRHRLFGLTRGTRMPLDSIIGIRVVAGGQSGSRAYWTISFEQKGGMSVRLWQIMEHRRNAEWLAAELRRIIHLN